MAADKQEHQLADGRTEVAKGRQRHTAQDYHYRELWCQSHHMLILSNTKNHNTKAPSVCSPCPAILSPSADIKFWRCLDHPPPTPFGAVLRQNKRGAVLPQQLRAANCRGRNACGLLRERSGQSPHSKTRPFRPPKSLICVTSLVQNLVSEDHKLKHSCYL